MSDSLDPSLYDYHLPEDRIAQSPAAKRDDSRLLRLQARRGEISHHRFSEIGRFLHPGDVLVVNDTRVVPVRLVGKKATGGKIEALLLTVPDGRPDGRPVECLVKGAKSLKPGLKLFFDLGLVGTVTETAGFGRCRVAFACPEDAGRGLTWAGLLARIGRVPLPPYIKRDEPPRPDSDDAERYQTVYARTEGAVAAPTAGLHFTPELIDELTGRGVELVTVTLHVGYGTFEPLRERHLKTRRLHPEPYTVSAEAAERINAALDEDRRVVAVGTTTVRVLEHLAASGGVRADSGRTELFIAPGFEFKVVRAMITNFHLPATSLMMLVSALAGRERILAAYETAVEQGYRFYSYGDAMLIET